MPFQLLLHLVLFRQKFYRHSLVFVVLVVAFVEFVGVVLVQIQFVDRFVVLVVRFVVLVVHLKRIH
jgi:hypothetical protein